MFSILMAMLMFLCCIDFSFIYAEGDDIEYSNTLNEWYIQATWNNDSTEYNLSSSKPENLYPKLTIRYYVNQARRDYNAGDIVITIPGIGGVKRGTIISAETTTTQSGSEWNMTYDSVNDVYTFTNKNSIPANQIKSGGFEMMWEFYSRDGENGYTASGSPTFSLKGGEEAESITLPEMKFSYTSEKDTYNIVLTRENIKSSQFDEVAQGENDRIWYQYTTNFNPILKARGVYKSDYFIRVGVYDDSERTQEADIDYEQIEVYFPSGKRTNLTKIIDPETNEEVYGFYTFTDNSNISQDIFYLGLPKEINDLGESIDGKQILVQSSFIILYNDETEYVIQHRESSEEIIDGNLVDDNQGEISDYGFKYLGNDYWQTKESSYSSVATYSDRLLSNLLYNSKVIDYKFTASTSRNYDSSASTYSLRTMAMAVDADDDDSDDENSDFEANTPFQFIQGDDRVAIELASGAMRRLEKDEYDFAYITIPKESKTHNYTIYVSDDGTIPFEDYTVYKTGTTKTNEAITIQLQGDVNAFYVAIEDVVGNYKSYIDVGVRFTLDWDEEQKKSESERINPEGKIANFSYFRIVYKNSAGELVNYAATDGNNYTGSYGLQVKADDAEFYNEYLYRKSCTIPLRTAITNISSTTTSVKNSEIIQVKKNYGEGFVFNTTTSGTVQADESGELKKFSIYAVLQNDDMKVDKSLNDVICSDTQILSGIQLKGSGTTVDGKAINNFSDYVSYEVRKTTDGHTVVVANFDFTDQPLEISKLTSVSMTFPVKIDQNDYDEAISHTYNVNSYTVVHDKGISKVGGKAIMSDLKDIDADGNLSEQIAYSTGVNNLEVIVREWEVSADKFVATYLTDDYVHSSKSQDVEAFSWDGTSDSDKYKYSYRLNFNVGNPISDAVFYDNIERDEKYISTDGGSTTEITSDWYGTFLSVNTSALQSLGVVPTVYYSSQEYSTSSSSIMTDYQDTSVWTKMTQTGTTWTAPEGADVKSIAIHTDLSEIDEKSLSNCVLYAIVNMRTPTANAENLNKKTYNKFSIGFKEHIGDNITTNIYSSDFTEVILAEERPELVIKKIDKDTNNIITGARFTIYTKDDEGNYAPVSGLENLEVGRTGYLTISKGLKYEQEYYYRETTAPLGYAVDDNYYPFSFEKTEETKTIEVSNTRLTGTLYFTKKDADYAEYSDDTEKDITSLEGAEYSIYKSDGTKLFANKIKEENGTNIYEYSTEGTVSDMITGTNGFKLTNLPWGNYYIIETTAPNGYELDSKKLSFSIQKSIAEQNASEIKASLSQSNTEKTASIKLIKTDSQNANPLKGARFNLERLNSDGEWETVIGNTNITTNVMGELLIENIKFGTYRLKEINAPIGYELANNPVTESVTLNASTVGKTLELKMQNDRKTGSATMTKYSDDGKTPLSGAKYDLYMVIGEIDSEENGETNDQPIKYSLITDTSGITPTVSGLEWGKYYFVEASAPKGYKKSDEKISFEITADNVDIRKDMTQKDTKILGSVKLTKIAGDAVSPYAVGDILSGVEFELYTKSGTQIKATKNSDNTYSYDPNGESTFITGDDGTITVKNLPWDSYYFEETKALNGFALADKVRFTINASNCNSVQELECENKKVECSLKVVKDIDTSVEDFGTPTFLFKITKLDEDDKKTSTSYTKMLTIKSGNTGSFILLVDPGEYLVEEIKVARYNPKSVEIVTEETTTTVYSVDNSKYTANVTLSTTNGEPETACVKFTNELYRYDKVSHNSSATNIIAANRKITGISAEYNAGQIPLNKTDSNSTYTFDKASVTYKILYDDGSEEEIVSTDTRYQNFTPESFTVSNGVNDAGQIFQQNVSYTDSTTNKTYKAQFDVEVAPLKVVESIKVIFKVDAENSCYFSIDSKRTTANVVYYNEDSDENKIAVSGTYVVPTTLDAECVFSYWTDADGNFIATDEEALKQYLKTTDKNELTLYANISPLNIVADFDYKGDIQEFIAPIDGYYKLEVWGAAGGDNYSGEHETNSELNSHAGAGGYSYGTIYLKKDEKVYVIVGGQGTYGNTAQLGGYNGGGGAQYGGGSGSGGGMTHISRTQNVVENDTYKSAGSWNLAKDWNPEGTIIVAGGGGGTDNYNWTSTTNTSDDGSGGYGGGLIGGAAEINGRLVTSGAGLGGTQNSGYKQGHGQSETSVSDAGGAGGGWYGGTASNNNNGGGGGGSGYISDELIMADTIGGNNTFLAPDGTEETGHWGNGYARITYINPYKSTSFYYTGDIQTFTAPQAGYYKLETWGAQGGGSVTSETGTYPNLSGTVTEVEGGRGGYTTANVHLNQGQTIYVAVSGQGSTAVLVADDGITEDYKDGGYNGGGYARSKNDDVTTMYFGGGGGATHIALTKQGDGQLYNYESNQDDVLVVAGGGGGSQYAQSKGNSLWWHHGLGGAGGGLVSQGNHSNSGGAYGKVNVSGSTQDGAADSYTVSTTYTSESSISKGEFGKANAAGGGGWYGGSAAGCQGGAGGSGHIGSKVKNGKSIVGTEKFLAPNNTVETGHSGNGYARITLIK